jgi:hypothetical protein
VRCLLLRLGSTGCVRRVEGLGAEFLVARYANQLAESVVGES